MEGHEADSEAIKDLFKGLWTLEDMAQPDSEIHQIIKKAIENPHGYVLKPQKEGGGHNFYDEELHDLLIKNNTEYLQQFLIMERIEPPEIKAHMLRNGVWSGEQKTL